MTPSKYQAAVYNFITNGQGDGIVDAVPGSGKTTTLVEVAKRLPKGKTALVCSFNKHIAEELGERMPKQSVTSSTINAFGYAVLRENKFWATIDRTKYTGSEGIVATLITTYYPHLEDEQRAELRDAANALVNMARLTLTGPNNEPAMKHVSAAFNPFQADTAARRTVREGYIKELQQLAFDYNLNQGDLEIVARIVIDSLVEGIKMATNRAKGAKNVIDFTDQVWLPVVLRLPARQYDYVMVDEAQDLNRCQLNLVIKAQRPGGRMLFVGDRHQAIYMFAGADSASMDKIQTKLNCTALPLSICYRCPKSHVELAAGIYPGIEAREDAPAGELSMGVEEDWAIMEAKPTMANGKGYQDIFICRNTAPLISVAYRLIRSGKPAKVRGKQIGEGLIAFVDKVNRWGKRKGLAGWKSFDQAITGFVNEKADEARASLKEDVCEAAIEALNDKAETLRVIIAVKNPKSMNDLKDEIVAMFSDNGDQTVWLSTVHKAKGLEARRVFIVEPQLMPSKYARTTEAMAQEENLRYIAYTRAKESLFILNPRPKAEDADLSV
jgi:DNA helicase II / ATP-dependent DNA helicase PcrA